MLNKAQVRENIQMINQHKNTNGSVLRHQHLNVILLYYCAVIHCIRVTVARLGILCNSCLRKDCVFSDDQCFLQGLPCLCSSFPHTQVPPPDVGDSPEHRRLRNALLCLTAFGVELL